jgi:hypothetical protein
MRGTYAYLEQDVDMQTFRRARDWPFQMETVYKRISPVRGFEQYTPPEIVAVGVPIHL